LNFIHIAFLLTLFDERVEDEWIEIIERILGTLIY